MIDSMYHVFGENWVLDAYIVVFASYIVGLYLNSLLLNQWKKMG